MIQFSLCNVCVPLDTQGLIRTQGVKCNFEISLKRDSITLTPLFLWKQGINSISIHSFWHYRLHITDSDDTKCLPVKVPLLNTELWVFGEWWKWIKWCWIIRKLSSLYRSMAKENLKFTLTAWIICITSNWKKAAATVTRLLEGEIAA